MAHISSSLGSGNRLTVQPKQVQRTISELRHKSEEEQTAALAKKLGLPYIDLNLMPVDDAVVRLFTQDDARLYGAAPFHKAGRTVRIAVLDPANEKTKAFIAEQSKAHRWHTSIYVASLSSLTKAWRAYQKPLLESIDALNLSIDANILSTSARALENLRELVDGEEDLSVTQVMQIIFAGGVALDASDIHIEPEEDRLRLRYRIDGILHDVGDVPRRMYNAIINRIKVMGNMKVNIRNIAQDGRLSVDLKDQGKVDVRISTIPGNYGESVVMRLLIKTGQLLDLSEMGLRGLADEIVRKESEKPNGMIVTTGPTGSGKTTTLYALLGRMNKPGVKIITIEDPIEYEIDGISQTQVSRDGKYTFAKGLRAIVRQDPDIILVGEIRDDETADIAVNAALTGHLVFTTIHANNAAATIPRFLELGVKPSLVAPSMNAFMAQRLVRRLCSTCKEEYEPATETLDMVKRLLAVISPKAKVEIPKTIKTLYRPKGCAQCGGTGYKGRIGIFEIFTVTEAIEKIVIDMGTEEEIMRAAMEDGMMTMTQDGVLKAVEGITSMEEVWRVTAEGDFLEDVYNRVMEQSLARAVVIEKTIINDITPIIRDFDALHQRIAKANQKKVLKLILAAGLISNAGDIHIEPEADGVTIRFRIDGVLQSIGTIPTNEYPSMLSNLKLLSGLKTEERHGVADSRFSIVLDEPIGENDTTRIDVRISFIVSGFGETIVMRLLNQSATSLQLESLGIREQNLQKLLAVIKKPYGILLNTGPTGSGKTTTLYSLLGRLNKPDVKIITVEDPIEYQMDGVLQTQVNEEAGYTFVTALRALLRQNPDIMMIGEIRDEETAQIAVQAALTGHLILSTLHTNSSAVSIQRLMNMGISTEDLATSVNAFMAQRLVRKLCTQCKKEDVPTPEERTILDGVLATISAASGVHPPQTEKIYRPVGCDACNFGYKGRTTISEVLIVDQEVQEMIGNGELAIHIIKRAVEKGMLTMTQDGVVKIFEGTTSLPELQRVTEL